MGSSRLVHGTSCAKQRRYHELSRAAEYMASSDGSDVAVADGHNCGVAYACSVCGAGRREDRWTCQLMPRVSKVTALEQGVVRGPDFSISVNSSVSFWRARGAADSKLVPWREQQTRLKRWRWSRMPLCPRDNRAHFHCNPRRIELVLPRLRGQFRLRLPETL